MAEQSNRIWRVGIDIGGTFTDIVAINDSDGERRIGKVPSRFDDPVGAIEEAIGSLGLDADGIAAVVHGTTRVTNAIVQGKLPPAALIATAGFEDSIEIGRLSRAHLYRLDLLPKLPPLVPASRRIGVDERLDHQGKVIKSLSDDAIQEAVDWVAALGVSSVAVSLLHSYANGEHEARLGQALAERGFHVSLSHQVNPEAREYERTAVTALNAAITPIAVDYLNTLQRETSIGDRLKLFHSAGGMATPNAVRSRPLIMAKSGPAAGVAASASLARRLSRSRVLTFDMGGTTTDVCLIVEGKAEVSDSRQIAERPIRMPMVAVDSIGAGGGSIVRVGAGGISVGPDSAGAEPGPACYSQGGQEATITDVNAALGYLNLDRKLGGRISLNREAAITALTPLAARLEMGPIAFALGATKVANATMARALRRVTVERGIDGRSCTLVAFGGAAPMHAAGLASIYGIREIVVPAASSVFSALGCVTADTTYTHQRTLRMTSGSWDAERFDAALKEAEAVVMAPLIAEGADPGEVTLEHIALVRYIGQSSLVDVLLSLPHDPAETGRVFKARHQDLFGFATDEDFEIQSLRSVARLPSHIEAEVDLPVDDQQLSPIKVAPCWFNAEGPLETPRYDRSLLGAGRELTGPAILEDESSTVVLPPGWSLRVESSGDLILEDLSR